MNDPDIKLLQRERNSRRQQAYQLQDTESLKTFRSVRNIPKKLITLAKVNFF